MSNYQRSYQPGGIFFFTLVTYKRRKLFNDSLCRSALRNSIKKVRSRYPFSILAWVLLPDHLHCIWQLPVADGDVSLRWRLIKSGVTRIVKSRYHTNEWMNESRKKRKESTIWQRRYWEHHIEDDKDYHTHLDYIHYNPVKHKLVERVKDWRYSTFHNFVKSGVYKESWGSYSSHQEKQFGE